MKVLINEKVKKKTSTKIIKIKLKGFLDTQEGQTSDLGMKV
jgi:hypothetical protein